MSSGVGRTLAERSECCPTSQSRWIRCEESGSITYHFGSTWTGTGSSTWAWFMVYTLGSSSTKGKDNHFGRGCEFALSVAATAMVPSPVTSSAVRKCTSTFTLVYPFFVRYITIRFQPSPTSFVNALGSNVLVTRDPWPVGWTVRLRMGYFTVWPNPPRTQVPD